MSHAQPNALISDADVLIDFVAADLEVLGIIAKSVWQLHVALPVLKEVKALTISEARRVGLMI